MTTNIISTTITTPVTIGSTLHGVTLTVSDSGAIQAATGPALASAPAFQTINIANYGSITAAAGSYSVLLNASSALYNYGYISGLSGVGIGGGLINNGTILGTGVTAGSGIGVALSAGSYLENHGLIQGASLGAAAGSAVYVKNTDIITGGTTGLVITSARLANSGSIGGGQVGVNATAALIGNTGYISGGYAGIMAVGGSIDNAGTIGGGTFAVRGSNLNITIEPGAVFAGAVDNISGSGQVTLGGTGGGSLDISDFSGFQTIDFASADWTLAGSAAQFGSGETIGNVRAGDDIVLNGFSASGMMFDNTSGQLVLSNATGAETLVLAGLDSFITPSIAADAGGTTIFISNTISNSGTEAGFGLIRPGYTLENSGLIAGSVSTTTVSETYGPRYIRGGAAGFYSNVEANIVNTGTITGYGNGIMLDDGGNVLNAGTLAGIGIYDHYYVNSGLGTGGLHSGYNALLNLQGALAVTAAPGAVFSGGVYDLPKTGTLVLAAGSVAGSLDMAYFTGFATIDFAPGSTWTLEGGVNQFAAGESISGFSPGDTLVLDGFAATSGSYIAGTGLVLSNATASETLHLSLSPGSSFISAHGSTTIGGGGTAIGSGTTVTSVTSTISSLGVPGYVNPSTLSITGIFVQSQEIGLTLGTVGSTVINLGTISGIGIRENYSGIGNAFRYTYDGAGIVSSGRFTLVNDGDVYGVETGISLSAGGNILNAGTIEASGAYHYSGRQTLTFINGNEQRGFSTTITHGQGIALYNASGALTVTVLPGAEFIGAVIDEPGDGTLVLGGSTAGTIDLSSFTGLPTIEILGGSDWTLKNASGSGIAGSGFVNGDSIVFEGFSATSNSYISGVGLVLSDGTASETLHLPGLDATELNMVVGRDGTTIVAPISTISTNVELAKGQNLVLGSGTYASSITITSTGTVGSNYGGIAAGEYGGVITGNGAITNAGVIAEGVKLSGYSTVINTGVIENAVYLQSGVVVDAGSINPQVDLSEIIEAQSSLTVILEPGAKIIGGISDDTGDGTLVLAGNNPDPIVFEDYLALRGFDQISFAAGHHDLSVQLDDFSNGVTLNGFGSGDMLQLIDYNGGLTASYVTGTGIVVADANGGGTTLAISGGSPPGGFVFTTQDSEYEIDITAACFCRGTRIGTPSGKMAVERLAIGDVVTTDLGPAAVKWIGRRDYDGAFIAGNHLALPVRIRRHALGFNVPSRDVFLSPDHGVCEGGVFVPAWRLVNGVSITQAANVERVEYFHIELEKPAVIFAENMPVESFVDADCRARFQNAAEYGLLYPEPAAAQTACRPRIEDGFLLQRIQSRINTRAGLAVTAQAFGPLRGCIDETSPRLRGWAQDISDPETPVLLEILHDGAVIGTTLANAYRPDLRKASLGSGCHAFDLALPPLPGPITLRRAGDGATINAPQTRAA